ncbi:MULTISPECIES: CDP-glycerol glycerophosphotransferase family protein [unclassified Granulicatella]|uniref:CDP-glycerol glycerophosphotransferase family protein n=1 Tax=unclassified Granulicatella TaxID=2630493 RepID=UPI0010740DFB|nr:MULTISPECIES: CDP-glycerol glycerophosphotransferase family protein [unclassified Granulicatella]MBF0780262.1 CDP-glycerol glycerophosphotransferase family protein [Granulicatella sp. 19428wC4_WM01]TFU95643.1 teichoic acid biosynthesis protein B [Granulicatella sp. WM01]
MKKICEKLRLITLKDILSLIFIFPLAYIISLFYRRKNKRLILICESEYEARDNGYWLYKYIVEHDADANVIYAINKRSKDLDRIRSLGKWIHFGSFKHWVYYLSANVNVSTQKGGKPNAAVFYLLEVFGLIKNKRIFLQHGITISNAKWLYYENTKMNGFVCGAYPEYQDIVKNYGYPEGVVRYLGFPRFDKLHDVVVNKTQILLMPSWREWLFSKTDAYYQFNEGGNFVDSEYFQKWNSFLSNPELSRFLEKNNLELIFYPHRNIQKYLSKFHRNSSNIVFASWEDYDIQTLLKESALMITDYSSVCMDFAYMRKPSIYYQFDLEKFRIGQYEQGYFDYAIDGFGEVVFEEYELVNMIKQSYELDFKLSDVYLNRINNFFPLYDTRNCERNYDFVKELLKK